LWPPGCIQMPSRFVAVQNGARRPTTMPDAVTWVGPGVLVTRRAQSVELGQEALPGRHFAAMTTARALYQRAQVPSVVAPAPDSPSSASQQLTAEHRGGVPRDADPLVVGVVRTGVGAAP